MTIFQMIKRDHKVVGDLLSKIEKTSDGQIEKKRTFFELMKEAFEKHARSEERAVYSALKEKEKTRLRVFQNLEEHRIMDQLLEELSDISPSQDVWSGKFKLFKELVTSHVKEEESKLFKAMRSVFDRAELSQMASIMKEFGDDSYGLSRNLPDFEIGPIPH